VVEASGLGVLHLMSISDHRRVKTFGRLEGTRFHVGFSHGYNRYMLYWEGGVDDDTVIGPLNSRRRQRLGNSWRDAIEVNKKGEFFEVEVDVTESQEEEHTTIYNI